MLFYSLKSQLRIRSTLCQSWYKLFSKAYHQATTVAASKLKGITDLSSLCQSWYKLFSKAYHQATTVAASKLKGIPTDLSSLCQSWYKLLAKAITRRQQSQLAS